MRAKTLYQPWAGFIAWGCKTVETRDYAPPDFAIGEPLAIHAAARTMREAEWTQAVYGAVEEIGRGNFPYGAIVATTRLDCAHQVKDIGFGSRHQQYALLDVDSLGRDCGRCNRTTVMVDPYGDFSPGRWLWFLEDIVRLYPPIPARGCQARVWTVRNAGVRNAG